MMHAATVLGGVKRARARARRLRRPWRRLRAVHAGIYRWRWTPATFAGTIWRRPGEDSSPLGDYSLLIHRRQ